MKIVQLAPLWKPVPPDGYGGSELVVSLLTEALVAAGHEVTLFACGGSQTTGNLQPVIDRPLYDILGRFDFSAIQPQDLLAISQAYTWAQQHQADIIHNHMGFHTALMGSFSPIPMVTTNHSSIAPDFPDIAQAAKKANFVSISNAQRTVTPYLNYAGTVYHGIDTSRFPYNETPKDYLLFLATMWNEKGVDRAIEIAKRTGLPLIMAGDIRRQSDFEAIQSEIDGEQIRYLGEVDFATKVDLFRNARAYLFPIRWNEAFGLTVAEALACGTPVIAWPNGSLPELVEHGKTGFLVNTIDEAVDAVKQIDTISRATCHQTAVNRFDASVMAANYVTIYQQLLA